MMFLKALLYNASKMCKLRGKREVAQKVSTSRALPNVRYLQRLSLMQHWLPNGVAPQGIYLEDV
ncbi:MAG: hypothetical protein HC862_18555 [Scytonema sp. RU_4_4]|nr:hypothetical protein [Scytonema sp. RU_4_4]